MLEMFLILQTLPDKFENPSLFCANKEGSNVGTCPGDSGGPIRIFDDDKLSHVQIGVVHGSIRRCDGSRFPSIFVRLDNPDVMKFIKDTIYGINTCGAKQKIEGEYARYKSYEECKFPFVYDGKVHYGCTDYPLEQNPRNQLWCSTETNSSTYEHLPSVSGNPNWGICSDSNCEKAECYQDAGNLY